MKSMVRGPCFPSIRWNTERYSHFIQYNTPCKTAAQQRTQGITVPWTSAPIQRKSQQVRSVQQRHGTTQGGSQLARKELIGFDAIMENEDRKKGGLVKLGVVTAVLEVSDTGAAHPLLRISTDISNEEEDIYDIGTETTAYATSRDIKRSRKKKFVEEHLIPMVRSIVPKVDFDSRSVFISPPEGLLDLGRRKVRLKRIKQQLEPLLESNKRHDAEGKPPRVPMMPTRKQLMDLGRKDLVRQISEAGGFIDVAQELGYRSVRRPPGFWEDEQALDMELSLFVAANWTQFEDGHDNEDEDDNQDLKGRDEGEGRSGIGNHMGGDHSAIGGKVWSSGSSGIGTSNGNDLNDSGVGDVYWFNQVTRRVQWTEPKVPQVVELDDQGSVVWAEGPENRAMPSRSSLLAAGRYDLHAAIMSAGGYIQVAEDLDRWPAWPPTGHLRGVSALTKELKGAIEEHNMLPRRMPSATQLINLGRSDLHQAILRQGGYSSFAERIKWKSHRRGRGALAERATAAAEIAQFAKAMARKSGHPPRMPTHAELRNIGRHDLRHALQKHGSAAIAELAGLPASRQGGKSRRKKSEWLELEGLMRDADNHDKDS